MAEEYLFDHLAGELAPGDEGWLPLDIEGNPSGPAFLLPPPPSSDLRACRVELTHDGHLVSITGAVLDPPLNSNVDKRAAPTEPPVYVQTPPQLTSLNPTSVRIGSPDITLECLGSNFTPASVIVFAGSDVVTTFVSDTKLTTPIKPSTVSTPVAVAVYVRGIEGDSTILEFKFNAPK